MHRHPPKTMSLRTLGDVVRRSPPLVVTSPNDTVVTLAALLHERRVDAVAVLRDDAFMGLVTSRDVASCVARREDLHLTRVAHIMTVAPITLSSEESPARALATMRDGHFRHIPVVGPNRNVIGIVDVLHLAYDAIVRLQNSYAMIPTRRTFDFMRATRANFERPTLRPIVEAAPVVTLTRRHSVTDACEAMVRNQLAALVIVDERGVLDGIFTCRDATTRVVAKECDPVATMLEAVMTKSPDCASPDFTILESLQRMQACGFRHLPVVEDHSRKVVGLVNVLQLASDSLMQGATNRRSGSSSSKPSSPERSSASPTRRGQPASTTSGFGAFFANLFSTANYAQPSPIAPRGLSSPGRRPSPSPPPLLPSARRSMSVASASGGPKIHPRGSSFLASSGPPSSFASKRQFSALSRRELLLQPETSPSARSTFIAFKFRDVNDEFRKVRVSTALAPGCFDQFVVDVRRRFVGGATQPGAGGIKLKYIDQDGDAVLVSNDEDLASCLEDCRHLQGKAVDLRVTLMKQGSPMSSPSQSFNHSPVTSATRRGDSQPRSTPPVAPPSPSFNSDAQSDAPSADAPPATPPPPTPSLGKAQEAHQQMMNGNIDAAVTLFGEALQLDSSNAFAMGGRGAARLIGGNSTGAEEDYRSAIALLDDGRGGIAGDATFEMCISGLVESLIDQRRYEEAVSVAGRADAKSGGNRCTDAFRDELESSSAAARKALEAGEFGDAMSMFSNSLRVEAALAALSPDEGARADLRVGRAKCYRKLEDYDMALEDYEAAVKLEPENVAAHKGCAFCLAELEQMERALEMYEKANKLDPGDEEVAREIKLLKKMMPDPLEEKKVEIAKLGAMLGNMNFAVPKKK